MPIVLEAVALGPPRAKRQHRVEAIERLDRGLLIDAEYRGVLRRIDVEPDHVGGLTLEVRIIGGHVALQPMGLKPGAPPDSRDHHVIDPQRPRQLAAAPVGGTIVGRAPGPGQNAGFQPRRALSRRPPLMAGKQARQPLLQQSGPANARCKPNYSPGPAGWRTMIDLRPASRSAARGAHHRRAAPASALALGVPETRAATVGALFQASPTDSICYFRFQCYRPLVVRLRAELVGKNKDIGKAAEMALECHARQYVVNGVLTALNWRMNLSPSEGLPSLTPEVAITSSESGRVLFLDYFGRDTTTNDPLLIVEAKRLRRYGLGASAASGEHSLP